MRNTLCGLQTVDTANAMEVLRRGTNTESHETRFLCDKWDEAERKWHIRTVQIAHHLGGLGLTPQCASGIAAFTPLRALWDGWPRWTCPSTLRLLQGAPSKSISAHGAPTAIAPAPFDCPRQFISIRRPSDQDRRGQTSCAPLVLWRPTVSLRRSFRVEDSLAGRLRRSLRRLSFRVIAASRSCAVGRHQGCRRVRATRVIAGQPFHICRRHRSTPPYGRDCWLRQPCTLLLHVCVQILLRDPDAWSPLGRHGHARVHATRACMSCMLLLFLHFV
jgi:hypothetical protein